MWIFITFWLSKKQSRFFFTDKKICFPYAPRSYLRKLLMPFYAQNNFDFRLFERDGIILDQCALTGKKLTRICRLIWLNRNFRWTPRIQLKFFVPAQFRVIPNLVFCWIHFDLVYSFFSGYLNFFLFSIPKIVF